MLRLHALLRGIRAFFQPSASPEPSRSIGAHQVAALPVKITPSGKLKILLISTRGSDKLIIPKGWPMKGKADSAAAAIEAEEEAGVVGLVSLHSIGSYAYTKPKARAGSPIRVDVYQLEVRRRLSNFREKGQRRLVWLSVEEAAMRVDEPGLVPIIRGLAAGRAS